MTLYRERQRFTQPWLWLAVLAVAAACWYGVGRQLLRGPPFGGNPGGDPLVLAGLLAGGVALPLLFASVRLRTEVRSDGVYLRFFPFHLRYRRWAFDQIAGAEPVQYSPFREYGGWGIRFGRSGWTYTIRGTGAARLVLRSGKRILIGTEYPERLCYAIQVGMRGRRTN